MLIQAVLALLVYPGLALGLGLALVLQALLGPAARFRVRPLGDAHLAWWLAALAALVGLVLLPWPLHPLVDSALFATPLLAWAAIEAAFLLPLLRDLTSDDGARVRAASREAQLGVGGRAIVWIAVATTWAAPLWGEPGGLARAPLGLAAALALPAAIGWGLFGPERSLFAERAVQTPPLASALRRVAVLAAVALIWLPAGAILPPVLNLLLILAVVLLLALGLRWLDGRFPRAPLPHALRLCWRAALPLALAGLAYLAFVVQ